MVVPVRLAYPKEAWSAQALRRKISPLLERFLRPFPEPEPEKSSLGLDLPGQDLRDPLAVLAGLPLDRSVPPVGLPSGTGAARSLYPGGTRGSPYRGSSLECGADGAHPHRENPWLHAHVLGKRVPPVDGGSRESFSLRPSSQQQVRSGWPRSLKLRWGGLVFWLARPAISGAPDLWEGAAHDGSGLAPKVSS